MHKSVFISDLHLGSSHCRDKQLLTFLKQIRTENLYLIGDIVDGWRLEKKWYWPKKHSEIIKQIIRISNQRVNVYWISGNHDEFLRQFITKSAKFGNITISHRLDYISNDNNKYLVVHGDMFDYLMRNRFGRLVMSLGDYAYDILAYINLIHNRIRTTFNLPYWSFVKYLKHHAKFASNFIGQYETYMTDYVKSKNYYGIISGHIHSPDIKYINGIHYINDGDWVENCSYITEDNDGFHLRYFDQQ